MRANARLNKRDDKGTTARAHLEARARKTGGDAAARTLALADDIPDSLAYLHHIFLRLDSMRDSDMNGPKRFTPAHILGGMALFGWSLSPAEAEAIVAMDAAALSPGPWPERAR